MSILTPNQTKPNKPKQTQTDLVFKKFDKDGNGFLDKDELKAPIEAVCQKTGVPFPTSLAVSAVFKGLFCCCCCCFCFSFSFCFSSFLFFDINIDLPSSFRHRQQWDFGYIGISRNLQQIGRNSRWPSYLWSCCLRFVILSQILFYFLFLKSEIKAIKRKFFVLFCFVLFFF